MPPGTTTRAQQINYYAAILAKIPGKYEGTNKPYVGLSWADLYRRLAAQYPKDDPKQLADTVLGISSAQRLGLGAQAAGGEIGPVLNDTGSAIAQVTNSWLNSLPGFIASAIESGVVALFKDLWAAILGPLEIIAGVAIGLVVLMWAFKDDLAAVAMMAIK